MRILLTGATGFIGSAVLRLAVAEKHSVAALVRPESLSRLAQLPGVHVVPGTLAEPPWKEIRSFRPDVCVHAAWITTPGIYMESPENDWWVDASEAFIKEAVSIGVKRVVALGTCIEYKMTGKPLSEEHTPIAPMSRYARSKDLLHQKLAELSLARGFSLSWGRVFYPYGPGEHPERLCTSVIRKLHAGMPVLLQNPGSLKDYIFVDDLAAAILAVAGSNIWGPINLGTGFGVRVEDIARTLAELLGRPELVQTGTADAVDPFAFVVADARRLRGLGWEPQVTLRQGLSRLIEEHLDS